VDILINNGGILRDASFAKGTLADFHKVLDVHLFGSAVCSHAVWPNMRAASYGRILMTTSGIYGIVIQETRGVYLREGERTPEAITARLGDIADLAGAIHSEQPGGPGLRFLQLVAAEAGVAPGIGT
jgi:short chain dehydrogenase